jgi:predicted dehydrogenase
MNENQSNLQDFNRRDFLKSGSVATLMTMLGGVELFAQANAAPSAAPGAPKVKVAVIGLGAWGREILSNLSRIPQGEIAAICDTYPAFVRRASSLAPGAAQVEDYKTILDNKEIKAVIVATPTHKHKEVVLAALKAGKHVYCEAPLATTLEDAREIALAAKAAKQVIFQAGLQLRADPQRQSLLPFIRSGAIGQSIMCRSQWHKKTSWHTTSPKPEREKELNWRLSKETSGGLMGEVGCHPIDQASWFLNAQPKAVTGFGTLARWKEDGRDVPDTVQAVFEFPNGITVIYDATLANSFDAEYEMLYGTDAAIMLRDGKAWLFKEVDSPLLGWEVYATKETFYKETGIVLKAGTSKAVTPTAGASGAAPTNQTASASAPAPTAPAPAPDVVTNSSLTFALTTFLRNSADLSAAAEDAKAALGDDDAEQIAAELAKVQRRPAAGYVEGYQSAVTVIKANEAILSGKRIEFKPEWYELG